MNLSDIEIIEVSVHYGETKSLPDYSNVKPGYTLTGRVKPGQDPAEVVEALAAECKRRTWEDCDTALEREGRPAEFYQGPRYNLRVLTEDGYAVIVPSEAELPDAWNGVHTPKSGWRLAALRKYVQENYGNFTLIDLSINPFEMLPDLQKYDVIWLSRPEITYCLILPGDFDNPALPEIWQSRSARGYTYQRLAANFLAWITEAAKAKEAILIDCLDGDLSKLPDLTPKEATRNEAENIMVMRADKLREEVQAEREMMAKLDALTEDDDDDNDDWEDEAPLDQGGA